MLRRADRHLPLRHVLTTGVVVTGLGLVESLPNWPYAPFPLGHALLAILIPLACGDVAHICAEPRRGLRGHTLRLGAHLLLFAALYICVTWALLETLGRTADPKWNILASYQLVAEAVIAHYGLGPVLVIGYLLLGIWPMVGEELFYRGFLFRRLQQYMHPTSANLISSILFGLRHAAQLVFLLPAYPVAAGYAYFVWAFGFAVFWCWSYRLTGSIWPSVLTHSANLALAPVVFAVFLM